MDEIFIRIITGVVGGTIFFGTYFAAPFYFSVLLILTLVFILIIEWPRLAKRNKSLWFLTPIYPILSFALLLWLHYQYREVSLIIPLYPFLISWINDTGAYTIGKLFGQHKVCTSVSPMKSWEGCIGGFICVTIANYFFLAGWNVFLVILVSLALSTVAFLGDIFVSYLKRKVHLKDSGKVLPGHGGLLDRFDSVLFVVVVISIYFLL